MQPIITFKNIKSSPEVVAYATKKLQKLDKYRDFKFIESRFIFSTTKEDNIHFAELIIQVKNDTISALAEEKSMYQAIDEAVLKARKQLEKKKTAINKRRYDPANPPVSQE